VKRTLLITGLVILALLGALAWVREPAGWPSPETPPQQGEAAEPASANKAPTHAALALARLIREPQNTWSNLAFVLGGAFLVSVSAQRLARCVGGALIGVGSGSFLYHASASRELRHLDVAAMYWVFLAATALCISALWPRWRPKLEAHAMSVLGAALLAAVALTAARNVVIAGGKPFSLKIATAVAAGIVIVSLAIVARRRENVSVALQFLGIVTLFGVAVAFQTADRPGGRLFRPDAFIQAHAVWHVLAAAAFVWAVRLLDQAGSADSSKKPDIAAVAG
jgi:hypothetical protein